MDYIGYEQFLKDAVERSVLGGVPPYHHGPSLALKPDTNHVIVRFGGYIGQRCES
jgi:hypothetical protein